MYDSLGIVFILIILILFILKFFNLYMIRFSRFCSVRLLFNILFDLVLYVYLIFLGLSFV